MLWRLSDAELEGLVAGTAMTRASIRSLRRNLALAIGNAAGAIGAEALDHRDEDDVASPSLRAPEVVEAIQWARARLHRVRFETPDDP
jgi:epoxyqueuosine reductase QueG